MECHEPAAMIDIPGAIAAARGDLSARASCTAWPSQVGSTPACATLPARSRGRTGQSDPLTGVARSRPHRTADAGGADALATVPVAIGAVQAGLAGAGLTSFCDTVVARSRRDSGEKCGGRAPGLGATLQAVRTGDLFATARQAGVGIDPTIWKDCTARHTRRW